MESTAGPRVTTILVRLSILIRFRAGFFETLLRVCRIIKDVAEPVLRSGEDVEAILKIALRNEHGSVQELRDRLARSADELGISPEALALAEEQYRKEAKIDKFMVAKQAGFRASLITYGAITVLLNVIYTITMFGKFYWPGIVLAAFGVALAGHFNDLRQRPTINDRKFQLWLESGEPASVGMDTDEWADKTARERLER